MQCSVIQCSGVVSTCRVLSCRVYSVSCTVYSVQCTVYSVQCTVSAVTAPLGPGRVAQQQLPNSTTCEVLAKTFSTSIPSVRLMLPADPSGVPGLGLDTVFLDLHTPDLA